MGPTALCLPRAVEKEGQGHTTLAPVGGLRERPRVAQLEKSF